MPNPQQRQYIQSQSLYQRIFDNQINPSRQMFYGSRRPVNKVHVAEPGLDADGELLLAES